MIKSFTNSTRVISLELRPIDNAILAECKEENNDEICAFLRFTDLVNFIGLKLGVIKRES